MISEDQKEKNLEFWNQVEKTDPDFTKRVQYPGRDFTTIDAMYQAKNYTAVFGMYGVGWGRKDEEFDIRPEAGVLFYKATLWFKMPGTQTICEIPLASSVKLKSDKGKIDPDCVKKVRTDAFTKEISFQGFNADVFMGKFDDNKYVESLRKEKEDKEHLPKNVTPINYRKDSFENVMVALKPNVPAAAWSATLKAYGYSDISEVKDADEQAALFRTMRSYTNQDAKEQMLMKIDKLRPIVGTIDKNFYSELIYEKTGDSQISITSLGYNVIAVIYRAMLFQANTANRQAKKKKALNE